MSLLEVNNLRLSLPLSSGRFHPVDGVSFRVEAGECVGLVGESGCGKSLTSMSLIGLTRRLPGARCTGQALWHGGSKPVDLLSASEGELAGLRGSQIAMVFQDPLSALNPLLRIDYQIGEVLARHKGLRGTALSQRVIEVLDAVGMPQAAQRARQYPHQLSGGLRQRVMLAMALAGEPRLLIADEPTTALDVTVQAQILLEIRRLQQSDGLAVLFITHDLGVVAQLCDRVMVMYAGRIVESAPVEEFFESPRHPYSRGLLASLPSLGASRDSLYSIPGSPPRAGQLPQGCRFNPRCPLAVARCREGYPPLEQYGMASVACFETERVSEEIPLTR